MYIIHLAMPVTSVYMPEQRCGVGHCWKFDMQNRKPYPWNLSLGKCMAAKVMLHVGLSLPKQLPTLKLPELLVNKHLWIAIFNCKQSSSSIHGTIFYFLFFGFYHGPWKTTIYIYWWSAIAKSSKYMPPIYKCDNNVWVFLVGFAHTLPCGLLCLMVKSCL